MRKAFACPLVAALSLVQAEAAPVCIRPDQQVLLEQRIGEYSLKKLRGPLADLQTARAAEDEARLAYHQCVEDNTSAIVSFASVFCQKQAAVYNDSVDDVQAAQQAVEFANQELASEVAAARAKYQVCP